MSREEARPWGRWLRRYRDERDLTQDELGEVLGVDGKTISAWENGQRPGRRHARTICARLRTSRAELGLDEAAGPVVGRRDFLRLGASMGMGGVGVGMGSLSLFGAWAGMDRVHEPSADVFEAATEALERLCMRAGAAATLGPALGHAESVTRLLQGSLPGPARPRLCGVLAESCALVARCKSWLGDPRAAEHFAAIAVEAAGLAGDQDLAVHVLLSSSLADHRLADQPEVRLSRYVAGDHGFLVPAAAPPTRAWAAVLAAGVHAELGHAEACLRALDEASTLLVAGPGRRWPWPDRHWLTGERGVSLALLGRDAEARAALGTALRETADERSADRLRWAAVLARLDREMGSEQGPATA